MFKLFEDKDGLDQMPAAEAAPELAPAKPVESPEDMQAAQAKRNRIMNALATIADNHSSENSYGNFWLKQMNPESTSARDLASKIQKDSDPMERQKKAYEYLKQKREMAQMSGADDPNSADSLATAEQIGGMFPQFAKYVKGKSKAQIMELMPILSQKARGDEDRELKRMDMQMRNADRDEARRERLDAKALKQKELSATQAKQRGLYDIGQKAEQQYGAATSNKDEYDPTGVGQWIDNSSWAPNILKNNKAIESQSAQKSWIESFLRDASGAAIPESERAAYAEIYFPQPGDPEDVVKNKAALRAQKMESARIAAGAETGHGPESMVASAPASSPRDLARQELLKRKAAKQTAGR